jgi:hypothetical protein
VEASAYLKEGKETAMVHSNAAFTEVKYPDDLPRKARGKERRMGGEERRVRIPGGL